MEHVIRPVQDKDYISLLLGSRGRPASLEELIATIEATVERKDKIDLWVYVDRDDTPTIDLLAGVRERHGVEVHPVYGEATTANGDMYNILREANTRGPGMYFMLSDKVRFLTPGWDRLIREAYDAVPDRILHTYPHENANHGKFGAFPILSAEWANVTGRLMTDHFAYWYDDTWIHQVAAIIGRSLALDFHLEIQPGLTQKMQNLQFWDRYFLNLGEERLAEADRLRDAFRADMGSYALSLAMGRQAAPQVRAGVRPDAARLQMNTVMERQFSGILRSARPRAPQGSTYRTMEERALGRLYAMLIPAANAGNELHLQAILDNIQNASTAAEDLIARVEARLAEGRPAEAVPQLALLQERFPHFPETHVLAAELARRLGDAASAKLALETAEGLFIGDPSFRKRRALLCLELGNRPGAEAAFRDALAIAPDDLDALVSLGQLSLERGDAAEARRCFEAAAAAHPADPDAWAGLLLVGDAAARERLAALAPDHELLCAP